MSELPPNHVRAIDAAGVAVAMSDRPTAERALRAAIESVDALSPDEADLVLVLNDLIRLCLKHSSHALAEPLLLRLLDLKSGKGEEHPEYVTVLASLAAVRQALGRHEDAEQLWRRVIAIREQTLAPNHFTLATAFEHLAEVCAARGKFVEARQVSQRALSIREATLGPDHASLRSSRERIADLELLAGEDILDRSVTSSGPHARRALVPGDGADTGKAKAPIENPAPLLQAEPAVVGQPPSRPTHPPAMVQRRQSPAPVVPAVARKSPAPVPVPVKPEAYLSVLETLKDEITVEHGGRALATTSTSRMAALVLFLRQPKAAAIVGIGAITLPLAAWGVAGAVRSSELNWVDQKTPVVAAATPDTHALALGTGPGATTNAIDRRKDSATAAGARLASAATRASDATGKPTQEPVIKLQAGKRLSIQLESIGTRVQSPTFAAEPVQRLSEANDLAGPKSTLAMGAPQRARMIGALPTPRYPAQQLRSGAGGSVRVRFDVDTNGRPVMSTFGVVSSPLPQLSAAVKEVIPGIRFEPARTPWPESRAVVETVELTFYFATADRK
jgi:TonB family protein